MDGLPLDKPQLGQLLKEGGRPWDATGSSHVRDRGCTVDKRHPWHFRGPLSEPGKRPCGGQDSGTGEPEKVTPFHSITSSARMSTDGGTVRSEEHTSEL